MRISDWSSDVCSSDLLQAALRLRALVEARTRCVATNRCAAQASAVRAEPALGPHCFFEETPARIFVRKSFPELVDASPPVRPPSRRRLKLVKRAQQDAPIRLLEGAHYNLC